MEKLSRAEREALLIKGAKEEKDVMFYATTPVNQGSGAKESFQRALSIRRFETLLLAAPGNSQ